MTCTGWLCSLRRAGRSRKEHDDDEIRKPNVNEEYLEAFRTKSYIEICNKAQENTTCAKRLSSSSCTEYLLEPPQEMVANMKVHHLLVDYFEASFEACCCCDTILQAIQSTRHAYGRITRLVRLSKTVDMIYKELASFAMQNNPLAVVTAVKFRDIRGRHVALLHRLTSNRRKINRRLALKRVGKNVAGIILVASHGAVLIALLLICFHSVVGLVAAPSIMCGLVSLFVKKKERVLSCSQLDVAAKGVYIVMNDMDTMSRMVKRLQDEVEHRKSIAHVCVRNSGKCEILKRVMSEFRDRESSFLEQLGELEKHVYLCFLTINKSRRLVMQQITQNIY